MVLHKSEFIVQLTNVYVRERASERKFFLIITEINPFVIYLWIAAVALEGKYRMEGCIET